MEKPFPAYRGDEPCVFVCYAHTDAAQVYEEFVWLKADGLNLWYDEGIGGGRVWREEIASALNDARAVLYFVSESSVASAHCNREIGYALDADIPVLPVYLKLRKTTTSTCW